MPPRGFPTCRVLTQRVLQLALALTALACARPVADEASTEATDDPRALATPPAIDDAQGEAPLRPATAATAATAPASASSPAYGVFWAPEHRGRHTLLARDRAAGVSSYGCNAVAFAQVPGAPTQFLGRQLQNTPGGGGCSGSSWQLVLATMNWSTHALSLTKSVFTPPAALPSGQTVTTAYDPSLVAFNGELWVTFECHGVGFAGSVGACLGPYTERRGIDVARTSVVVQGTAFDTSALLFSASVPKLLVHAGRPYLYWTAVKMNASDGHWIDITTRGAELGQEPGGLRRLLPQRLGGTELRAISSNDPAFSTEVWGLDAYDSRSNTVADVFSVVSDGRFVYATAGVGGDAAGVRCLGPLDNSPGCYRLALGRSTAALGHHVFTDRIPEADLPSNPQEYTRFFLRPDGKVSLLGAFLPRHDVDPPGPNELSPGLTAFDLPLPKPVCDAASQPAPHWGARDGACLKSCGALGGTASFVDACANHNQADVGRAYDVPFCCKAACDAACQPAPHWGARDGACLKSCGALGGTASFADACAKHNRADVGLAYDVPFCCRRTSRRGRDS